MRGLKNTDDTTTTNSANHSNLIKIVCELHDLSYLKLSEILGMSESSIRSAASTGKISKQAKAGIKMYLKIVHLEKEIERTNKIKQELKSWLN